MKTKKMIGHKSHPTSRKTFPNKNAATIVSDAILFHGAKVTVDVHNMYRSQFLRDLKMNIAAERSVAVEEDGIECSIDSHFARITLRRHKRGEQPPYGAFIWELPKRALKKFPLLIEYTKDCELAEVSVLRSSRSKLDNIL
jgi:hypothetical protein